MNSLTEDELNIAIDLSNFFLDIVEDNPVYVMNWLNHKKYKGEEFREKLYTFAEKLVEIAVEFDKKEKNSIKNVPIA